MSVQAQVIAFHQAFDHPIAESPTIPNDARVRLRARLIVEECLESIEALFAANSRVRGEFDHRASVHARTYLHEARHRLEAIIDQADVEVSLIGFADGLADLDYVVEGARLEFGINGAPIAKEVHRSNMAKRGGEKRPDGKTLKPEGWTPPDIAGVLELQRKEPHAMGLRGVLWTLADRAARREVLR